MKNKQGFSIIEIIMSMAILGMSFGLGFLFLNSISSASLTGEAQQLFSHMRYAQRLAIARKGNVRAGVHVESNRYIIFSGDSFATGTSVIDHTYRGSISATSTVADFLFEKTTGLPLQIGSIQLRDATADTRTITIESSGNIEWAQP